MDDVTLKWVHLLRLPLSTPWVAWSLGLYAFAMACWLPVLWIQVRLRDLARAADGDAAALPPAYWSLFRWWVGLGFGGLLSFLSPCVLPLIPAYIGYLSGTAVAGPNAETNA